MSGVTRILMLLQNAPYLLDSRVLPEAETLVAAGYEVTVICPGALREPWRETVNGVRVYRFLALFGGRGFLAYLWEYGYCLAASFFLTWYVFFRRGFDVIHAHNPPDLFFLIGALFKLLNKRFIYDQHDLAPEMYQALFDGGSRWVYRAMCELQKLSCRVADTVIVTNQSYKRIVVGRTGISEQRVCVVRNGPDLAKLAAVTPVPSLRQADKTLLCYVGVMGYHDGVDYLLQALQHLVVDLHRTDFTCVLVGRGSAWRSLRTLSKELGLDDYVSFVGWIDPPEVPNYIAAADICIAPEPSNPYNDRSTVIKIAEYMAQGKPIVAFDLPEHRATADGAAIYAEPNDVHDLARQILVLMDNPKQQAILGEIGRKRVEAELSWLQQARKLLSVYGALAKDMRTKTGSAPL